MRKMELMNPQTVFILGGGVARQFLRCVAVDMNQKQSRGLKMIIGIKEATEKGYSILNIPGFANLSYPSSKSRRGRVQNGGGYMSDNNNSGRSLQNSGSTY